MPSQLPGGKSEVWCGAAASLLGTSAQNNLARVSRERENLRRFATRKGYSKGLDGQCSEVFSAGTEMFIEHGRRQFPKHSGAQAAILGKI